MSGMTLGVKTVDDEPSSAILVDISEGSQGESIGVIDIKLAKK